MDEIAKSAKKIADDLRAENGIEVIILKSGNIKNSVKTIAIKNTETRDKRRSYFSFAEKDICIYDVLQIVSEGQLYEIVDIEKQEINNCFVQLKAFCNPIPVQTALESQEDLEDRIKTILNEFDGDVQNTFYKACEALNKYTDQDKIEKSLKKHYTKKQIIGLMLLKDGLINIFGDPNSQPIIEIKDKNELNSWLNVFSKIIKKFEHYDFSNNTDSL